MIGCWPVVDAGVEIVVCSGIWYDDLRRHSDQPVKTGVVVAGLRHRNCISTWVALTGDKDLFAERVQGFLTSEGRFVDRFAARNIAAAAGQIPESHRPGGELTSECLR